MDFGQFSRDFDETVTIATKALLEGKGAELPTIIRQGSLPNDPIVSALVADAAHRKAQAYECLQYFDG